MGEKKTRAKYTLEFKMEALRLIKGGQSVSDTAKMLGIPKGSLENWIFGKKLVYLLALKIRWSVLSKWNWPGFERSYRASKWSAIF